MVIPILFAYLAAAGNSWGSKLPQLNCPIMAACALRASLLSLTPSLLLLAPICSHIFLLSSEPSSNSRALLVTLFSPALLLDLGESSESDLCVLLPSCCFLFLDLATSASLLLCSEKWL